MNPDHPQTIAACEVIAAAIVAREADIREEAALGRDTFRCDRMHGEVATLNAALAFLSGEDRA